MESSQRLTKRGLYYACTGRSDQPPVLFLHGFLGSGSEWDGLVRHFADRFFCITVDLPGHGQSIGRTDPSAYSFLGARDAIVSIVDRLQIRNVNLIGYSMGGRLALSVAIHAPSVFANVVLESSSPGLETPKDRAERIVQDDELASEIESNELSTFLDRWYAQPIFFSLQAMPELLNRLKTARLRQRPDELARALRGLSTGRQPSYWRLLARMNVPLLLVTGELDQKYMRIGENMSDLCKEARTTIVPGAGHNTHVENPEAFIRVVDSFLEGYRTVT